MSSLPWVPVAAALSALGLFAGAQYHSPALFLVGVLEGVCALALVRNDIVCGCRVEFVRRQRAEWAFVDPDEACGTYDEMLWLMWTKWRYEDFFGEGP